jgi:uncharacterized protein YggE
MSRIVIGLFALLATASVASAQVSESVIVTRGQATVKRAPDRAWLTVSTEVRDAKPADARQRSADIMTTIQNALKTAGLPADAVRTTGYSITPEMVNSATGSTGQVRGYAVFNQIEVRVDELDKLPQVIDAVNAPKNAALSISGPRFDLRNREGAEQDVLRIAVENALARAQAIATGARRSLGAVLHVDGQNTGTDLPTPRPMMRATAGQTSTPINPGVIEIHAEVTLTVGIR